MQKETLSLSSDAANAGTDAVSAPASTATEILVRDTAPENFSPENEISDLNTQVTELKNEIVEFDYILTTLYDRNNILVKALKCVVMSLGLTWRSGDREWKISEPLSEPLGIEDIIEKMKIHHDENLESNWEDKTKEVSESEIIAWDLILDGAPLPSFDYDKFPDALIQIGGITISPPCKREAKMQKTDSSSNLPSSQ